MIVRVPASSANLGPGFDALGMAVALHARFADAAALLPEGARLADAHHPARVAFERLGGGGEVWIHHGIPVGRGLGFSGAMRVGGAALAVATTTNAIDRDAVLAVAAELEGHADNAAASVFGGVVATAGGQTVRVPVALSPALVVWIPSFETATERSRRQLRGTIPFEDAVFNVGRTALLVAALAAGDIAALRTATEDRMHQEARLTASGPSRAALEAALAGGAWGAWLSGSGPTVAALCDPSHADELAAAFPADGRARVLAIDPAGAVIEGPPETRS